MLIFALAIDYSNFRHNIESSLMFMAIKKHLFMYTKPLNTQKIMSLPKPLAALLLLPHLLRLR